MSVKLGYARLGQAIYLIYKFTENMLSFFFWLFSYFDLCLVPQLSQYLKRMCGPVITPE